MQGKGEMLVWVLQTGEPLPIDGGDVRPMRAINLCNALIQAGHRVVLWSALFDHQKKRHREFGCAPIRMSEQLELRLIQSSGYERNVGIGRLRDHAVLGRNLKRALRDPLPLPNVAFVGYPPIETAAVLTRWLRARSVPTLLDVKDQWPDVFLSAVPGAVQPAARMVLAPYYALARRAMREATGLSAMAEGFLNWALRFAARDRGPSDAVFPLTSPRDGVPPEALASARAWWDERDIRDDGTVRVFFAGTHSRAFDFDPVRDAASLSRERGDRVEFVFCGDGDESSKLRQMMHGLPNVRFPGWVDRPRLIALAERSQAALAPYRNTPDFEMSLPNKVIDALSLGLPILSPLRGEVGALIAEYGVGMSYPAGSGPSLYECVAKLIHEPELQARLAERAHAVYRQRFAFDTVYGGLVRHLEMLASTPVP